MTLTRISAALRKEVRERAGERCEYCLFAESQAFFPHEPDHLIAQKHGGKTASENLALACFDCNRFKGSDIASVDPASGENSWPYSTWSGIRIGDTKIPVLTRDMRLNNISLCHIRLHVCSIVS